jgi:hypothetical protein
MTMSVETHNRVPTDTLDGQALSDPHLRTPLQFRLSRMPPLTNLSRKNTPNYGTDFYEAFTLLVQGKGSPMLNNLIGRLYER